MTYYNVQSPLLLYCIMVGHDLNKNHLLLLVGFHCLHNIAVCMKITVKIIEDNLLKKTSHKWTDDIGTLLKGRP